MDGTKLVSAASRAQSFLVDTGETENPNNSEGKIALSGSLRTLIVSTQVERQSCARNRIFRGSGRVWQVHLEAMFRHRMN